MRNHCLLIRTLLFVAVKYISLPKNPGEGTHRDQIYYIKKNGDCRANSPLIRRRRVKYRHSDEIGGNPLAYLAELSVKP